MVSLIGPRWVECFDTTNPKLDFVEEEIKAVLRRGAQILPILVDGAITPEDYSKIPATIQDVLKRQMITTTQISAEASLGWSIALSAPCLSSG